MSGFVQGHNKWVPPCFQYSLLVLTLISPSYLVSCGPLNAPLVVALVVNVAPVGRTEGYRQGQA